MYTIVQKKRKYYVYNGWWLVFVTSQPAQLEHYKNPVA